jgi:hypothetical protein
VGYFANLTSDRRLIAVDADELVPVVSVEEIGTAAAAAATIAPPGKPDKPMTMACSPKWFSHWNRREHPQAAGPDARRAMGILTTSFREGVDRTFGQERREQKLGPQELPFHRWK